MEGADCFQPTRVPTNHHAPQFQTSRIDWGLQWLHGGRSGNPLPLRALTMPLNKLSGSACASRNQANARNGSRSWTSLKVRVHTTPSVCNSSGAGSLISEKKTWRGPQRPLGADVRIKCISDLLGSPATVMVLEVHEATTAIAAVIFPYWCATCFLMIRTSLAASCIPTANVTRIILVCGDVIKNGAPSLAKGPAFVQSDRNGRHRK